ncbi:DUF4843 domain-containing protein [Flavihumibacter solisilvae]|uniref:DUF4843 domain-containing protein n=1 Tax=Flavihumibacter solisilvae TaxID=1349421 RepID=A0A0C1L0L5_9BACT|nr:DUF4843 domain-containing protein [Flavihumibacter solisilvae]KIC93522.1 hypothetical protein OI18_17365 [Flavihumibacter solisilvae]
MNKNFIILLLVSFTMLTACSKSELARYDSNDNIYLDLSREERDSILYSFAYNPGKVKDTVWVPVRISGIRTDSNATADRKFVLKAETDSSTAKPDIHYQPLDPVYYIKKGTGFTWVPLVIFNTDPLLEQQSVTLRFRLFPTEDFGVNIPKLTFGKLVFSSKLERPNWWNMWFGDYYSRAKHEFFMIATGLTELSREGLDAPKNLYFVSLVNAFINDPFNWISKHPDAGYIMESLPDGNYNFYHGAKPTKKILYRKNEQANKYYFIDELGTEVK